ncbi:glutamate receptor [Senna tora]|uniref:Glutamate receptor n=1 Tax=Senna tora TaxID=362788 RepID=A0A834TX54_9FABA|nr:glutamate receptor [Senna tora]
MYEPNCGCLSMELAGTEVKYITKDFKWLLLRLVLAVDDSRLVLAAYDEWFSTDRLLVGWLRNAMSPEIGAQLLHCKTAFELWTGAKSLTYASTKFRVMTLKSELHQTRKNVVVQFTDQPNLEWITVQSKLLAFKSRLEFRPSQCPFVNCARNLDTLLPIVIPGLITPSSHPLKCQNKIKFSFSSS